MKRSIALLWLSLFTVGLLSGCNTVAGAGKDIKGAGETIEDTAKDCRSGEC